MNKNKSVEIRQDSLQSLEERIRRVAEIIDDMQGENIVVLDLRGLSDFADAFIIATARSRTHMQALSRELTRRMREAGVRPLSKTDRTDSRWTLVDYADVIVHLFEHEARSYYSLEQLWGDADQLDWQELATA